MRGYDDDYCMGSYRVHQEALPDRADLERCTGSLGTSPAFHPPPIRSPFQVDSGDLNHPILLAKGHLDLREQKYS